MQMNNLIYEKGEIIEKVSKTKLDWPNLTFYSGAVGEKFEEVRIVTLISHYEMICYEKAIDKIPFTDNEQWLNKVYKKAMEIMDSEKVTVQEMVKIEEDFTTLVVLDDYVINDQSVDRALSLIEQANIPGTTYFGKPVSFTLEQVTEHKN